MSNIFPRHYQELKNSFIDDDLIRLNIASFEGMKAQEEYFNYYEGDRLNTGAPTERLLEKTNFLLPGCWVAYTHTQDGVRPHFKPDQPKKFYDYSKNKEKVIKYVQVKGSKNGYFMPRITYRHVELIARKYKIKKYPKGEPSVYCEEAWEWIAKNKNIAIGIAEGSKKTLALCSIGVPCIGLTGVYNFTNYGKDKFKPNEKPLDFNLLDCFRKFEGHSFNIYHDMDEKEQTIKNVSKAAEQLTKALTFSKISNTVFRSYWDGLKGKGIDDYLFNNEGDLSELSCEQIIIGEKYQKVEADLTIHERYLTNKEGKGLPVLKKAIDSHRVVLIDSSKNTGKTTFASDYTYAFQMQGVKVFIPSHRRTLMSELSSRMNTANAENFNISLDKAFGLAMCIDSLHSNSSVRFTLEMLENFRDCILFIDEVDQVFDHLAEGQTDIKSHRRIVNENLIQLMQISKKIIATSADISQEVADFLEINCREKPFVIRNTYKVKGGKCKIYNHSKPYKLLSAAEKAVERGEKIMFFTTGQKETSTWSTSTLEKYFKGKYPNLKIGVVDAATVADKERLEFRCYEDYNAFIDREKFDILLVSPVVCTGTDITSKHFDSYWGINWGVISVNSFSQAMGRIRENIPRHIWSSNSFLGVKGNGSCFAWQLQYSQKNQLETNKLIFEHYDSEFTPYINDSLLKYWCIRSAIVNTQGKQMQKCTAKKFADDYEQIEIDNEDMVNKEKQSLADNLSTTKDKNISICYQAIIESPTIDDCQLDELRRKQEKTATERHTERANNTIRKISPRDKKIKLTPEILEAEDQGFFQKLELDWLAQKGIDLTHKQDKQRVIEGDFILDSNRKCKAAKVNYIRRFGLDEIISNPNLEEIYHNNHPLIQKVGGNIRKGFNKLAESKATIRDFWRTKKISPKSSDWNLVKWALELVGYGMAETKRNKQGRFYELIDSCGAKLRETILGYWDEEKLDLIEAGDKGSEAQNSEVTEGSNSDVVEVTVSSSEGDKSTYIYRENKNLEHLSPSKISELPETPSELLVLVKDFQDEPRQDGTPLLGDMEWTADYLRMMIEMRIRFNLSSTPLEAFRFQLKEFGWDVIKEAAKYSEAWASKVSSFVEQLIDTGEWGIAPG